MARPLFLFFVLLTRFLYLMGCVSGDCCPDVVRSYHRSKRHSRIFQQQTTGSSSAPWGYRYLWIWAPAVSAAAAAEIEEIPVFRMPPGGCLPLRAHIINNTGMWYGTYNKNNITLRAKFHFWILSDLTDKKMKKRSLFEVGQKSKGSNRKQSKERSHPPTGVYSSRVL